MRINDQIGLQLQQLKHQRPESIPSGLGKLLAEHEARHSESSAPTSTPDAIYMPSSRSIMDGATLGSFHNSVSVDIENAQEQVFIDRTWGSTTRQDGAKVTVGEGVIRDGDTAYKGIVVMVEQADGNTSAMALNESDVHRLTENADGGYDLNANLQGGHGNDLFVGRDLSGLNLNGGGGNNAVFTAGAAQLTYTGGAERDMIFAGGLTDSLIDLGEGVDGIKAGIISGSTINMGAGDDQLSAAEIRGGVLLGGQGDDEIESSLFGATVNLGQGDDSLRGYSILQSNLAMGGGDDRLKFYELEESTTSMSASVIGLAETLEAFGPAASDELFLEQSETPQTKFSADNDSIKGYEIISSSVATGDGNDSVNINSIENSTMDTGIGNDTVKAYAIESSTVNTGAGNDSLTNYELIHSQLDMGSGDDKLNTYDITGSEVLADGEAPDSKTNPHGDDEINAYNIEDSAIAMGGGKDNLQAYQMQSSTLITGVEAQQQEETKKNSEVQEISALAGSASDADTVSIYMVSNSTIDTGDDNDTIQLGSAQELLLGAGKGEDMLTVQDVGSTILANEELESTRQGGFVAQNIAHGYNRSGSAFHSWNNDNPSWGHTETLDFKI